MKNFNKQKNRSIWVASYGRTFNAKNENLNILLYKLGREEEGLQGRFGYFEENKERNFRKTHLLAARPDLKCKWKT